MNADLIPMLVMGSVFLAGGVIALVTWTRAASHYEGSLGRTTDLEDFLGEWSERPWLQAWRVGGWLGVAVGLVLIVISLVLGLGN